MKRALVPVVAGKLMLSVGKATAGAQGKTGTTQLSPLVLDEVGTPQDILSEPVKNAGNSKIGSGSQTQDGSIYAKIAANNRINFIIEGIKQDRPVEVFLAFSNSLAEPSAWGFKTGAGELRLDPKSTQLIAGLEVKPMTVMKIPDSEFGHPELNSGTLTIPVTLLDLSKLKGISGNLIYFQAIAIPVLQDGSLDLASSQVSDLDSFKIDWNSDVNQELLSTCQGLLGTGTTGGGSPGTGTKGGSSNSSSSGGGKGGK